MKIIIAGSRSFNDYGLLSTKCNYYLKRFMKFDKLYDKNPNIEVVSGTAKGADSLGATWAINNLIKVKEFPADWKNIDTDRPCVIKYNSQGPYNALAGHNRNQDMAEYALALIAFDMGTGGTKDMINRMKKLNKPYRVVEV